MQTHGMSLEAIQPVGHLIGKDKELVNNASESSGLPFETCHIEEHSEVDTYSKNSMERRNLEIPKEMPPELAKDFQVQKLPIVSEEDFPNKCQKVSEPENGNSIKLKATESSLVEWLKNNEEEVALIDILKHFSGSSEDSVVELLNCLESDFVIYKKNSMYWLL